MMASKCWAYFWWIFLGWFGVHHIYLKRYRHAFVTLWTFGGGFGVGWLMDAFCLGRYVRLANDIDRVTEDGAQDAEEIQNGGHVGEGDGRRDLGRGSLSEDDKSRAVRESSVISDKKNLVQGDQHVKPHDQVQGSRPGGSSREGSPRPEEFTREGSSMPEATKKGPMSKTGPTVSSPGQSPTSGAADKKPETQGENGKEKNDNRDYVKPEVMQRVFGFSNSWAPFSYRRVAAELCFSIYLGYVAAACVPSEYSHITILIIPLTALAVATGVHTVANIGLEEVTFKNCLKGMIFPLGFNIITSFLKTGTIQMEVEGILAALGISATVSANRLRGIKKLKKRPRRGCCSRVPDLTVFILASTVVMLVMGMGLYYNAEVTNKDGEKIPLREALRNIMDSPAWIELKATLNALWYRLINGGFWEFVNQLTTDLDLDGEEKAYKVLNLTSDATEKDIQKRYREYAVKYHPDKIKAESEEERKEAENRFMEINKAYERLSSLRQRRNRKNQKVEL